MTSINVSKKSESFAHDIAVSVSFSSEELAKTLGYEKEINLFLSVKPNPAWSILSNEHDSLHISCEADRQVLVRFFLTEYSNFTEVEFVVVEPKLKIFQDLTAHFIGKQTLFRERMRVKVLETAYRKADTTRIVHEFVASVVLAIADKLGGR